MFQKEAPQATKAQILPIQAKAQFDQALPRSAPALLQRSGCPCGGGCPRCRGGLPIQTKLAVGGPQSSAEKEADRIAEQIVEGHQPRQQRIGAVSQRIDAEAAPLEDQAVAASLELRIRNQMLGGEPLPEKSRALFESRLGKDLSDVRIHEDSAANASAGSLSARAFTVGKHIFFRAGEYRPDSKSGQFLLAHELVHVVQQGGGSEGAVVSRKPKTKEDRKYAPEIVDLMGQTTLKLGTANETYFEQEKKAYIKAKFGKLAEGDLEVVRKKSTDKDAKDRYEMRKQALKLNHPFFAKLGSYAPNLEPVLIVSTKKEELEGFIGLQVSANLPSAQDLDDQLKKIPQLFGIGGFDLGALSKFENKLENGHLQIGLTGLAASLGSVLAGSLDLGLKDEKVEFSASLTVHAAGLAEGEFKLKRAAETGVVTGEADIGLTLPRNITGKIHVGWDGKAFDGKGEVGYTGEKFNGKITLVVMDEERAKKLDAEKKAANSSEAGKVVPPQVAPAAVKPDKKSKGPKYVVFGDGMLDFSFTPWLTGNAQVIIDYKGDLTVIGEIKPQAEIELFAEKPWDKQLFKVEARATYGLPVVGNVFVFANIGMSAFARLGPGKFYKIAVKGTYSTDPTKANDFSIEGTLNISAAAGLKLRAEGGAGIQILDHDIKAGVGLDGIAGIKGYVEATPLIGYREVAKAGEDKKGEFYLKGDLEIAAQPFLGLSGDLFIEVDSPWWSPLPDDRWTWPLGSKEWPVGGSFGIGATTEYVFGSGVAPSLSFHPVEFSGDKFMSDVYSNKTQDKKGEGDDKKGTWKEKNSKKADPPPKKKEEPAPKPDKNKGKTSKSSLKEKPEKNKVKAKKSAEGKSPDELKREAAKGRGKNAKRPKGVEAKPGAGAGNPAKGNEENKDKAGITIEDILSNGIYRQELLSALKTIKGKNKLKSITLNAQDDVVIVNSQPLTIKGQKFGAEKGTMGGSGEYKSKAVAGDGKKMRQIGTYDANAPVHPTLRGVVKNVLTPTTVFPFDAVPDSAPRPEAMIVTINNPASFGDAARESGSSESRTTVIVGKFGMLEELIGHNLKQDPDNKWEGGHLFGHQFGGPDRYENLVPQRGNTFNRGIYKKVEDFTSKNINSVKPGSSSLVITYRVQYGAPKTANIIEIQKQVAKLTADTKGKDIGNKPNFIKSTIRYLKMSYASFAKIKDDMTLLRAELAKDSVVLDKNTKLTTVLDRWRLTDNANNKIYEIERQGKNLVWAEIESADYFGAKKSKPTETDATKSLTFVSRIPKTYDIELKFTGLKALVQDGVDAGGTSNAGGSIKEPNYFIIKEGGKPSKPKTYDQAMKTAGAVPAAKVDELSIVAKFNLNAN